MARNDRAVAAASVLMMLDNKKFNEGIKDTERKWRGFCDKIARYNSAFGNSAFGNKLVSGLNSMSGAVAVFSPIMREAGAVVANFARQAALAGGVAAGALAGGVAVSVKAAADLESEALKLKNVMGAEEGEKMLSWIREFYPNTSGSRSVFVQAAADLARLGMEAPEIERMLQAMGDAGVLSKMGTDAGISSLVEAFKNLNAQGVLSERTLRVFRKAGVDYIAILTEKLGSFQAAQEAVKTGSIDAATAQALFLEYMSRYYGAMQQESATAAGTLATIRAQFTEITAGLGEAFLPVLKMAGGAISDFLTYLYNNMPALKALLSDLFGWAAERLSVLLSHAREIYNQIYRIADTISELISGKQFRIRMSELFRGHWKFTESKAYEADRAARRADAWNYQSGDLSGILERYGFSLPQIRAGMAEAAAGRAAQELAIAERRGNYAAGGNAFESARTSEEMLSELQGINEKLDYIGGQNAAAVNAKIPVRNTAALY